jgi:hypothetical protein
MMPPIIASISRKSFNRVPITIFQMLLSGGQTHKNKAFFLGSRGFLWVWIMGSQNIMGLDYGSKQFTYISCCEKQQPANTPGFTFRPVKGRADCEMYVGGLEGGLGFRRSKLFDSGEQRYKFDTIRRRCFPL